MAKISFIYLFNKQPGLEVKIIGVLQPLGEVEAVYDPLSVCGYYPVDIDLTSFNLKTDLHGRVDQIFLI